MSRRWINLQLDFDEAKIVAKMLKGVPLVEAEKREVTAVLPHLENILKRDYSHEC